MKAPPASPALDVLQQDPAYALALGFWRHDQDVDVGARMACEIVGVGMDGDDAGRLPGEGADEDGRLRFSQQLALSQLSEKSTQHLRITR